ncbi:unnamed protein product [Parajaminaea phylloscopi]
MRAFGPLSIAVTLATLLVVAGSALGAAVLDLTDSAAFDSVIGKGRPALVEFYAPWCGHCQQLEPVYEQLAEAYSHAADSVIVAKVNADSNKELGKRFGITGFPTLKWFSPRSATEPEDYIGDRNLESLAEYVQMKSGGNLRPKIKAPPPPASLQLDASNFDEIALDPSKDVLVEWYAPWCGHCKRLAPIYDAVAKTYANEDNCIVAQINGDDQRNRALSEKYEIQGFPTIKFFPRASTGPGQAAGGDGSDSSKAEAAAGAPQTYMGGREEQDFVTFLNARCGVHRLSGGSLNDLAGRLPSLDSLASRLYTARLQQAAGQEGAEDEVQRIAADAKDFVSRVRGGVNATAEKDRVADYYLKIMDKLVVHGDSEYVDRETSRLRKILDKHRDALEASGQGTLAPRKADDVKRRLNVLSAFTKRYLSDRAKDAEAKARAAAAAAGARGAAGARADGADGADEARRAGRRDEL